jgi:nucleotide-binding universal stress UspA family protein
VTGREPHRTDFAGPTIGLLGELLHRSRTPLFIPADDGAPVDPTGTALIAWDGSYEAANAVRAAVGLLKIASQVRVLQIHEKEDEAFPGTKLLEYLSRHGIHAELFTESAASKEFVSDALVAHARAIGAAYLVMGGYNHSRVGEFVFGGVTRSLLKSSPVPLLIAH